MEVATQTVRYGSEGSTLLLGLIAPLGASAGMIGVAALQVQFAPIFKRALAVRRMRQRQAHAA
jgi:hypothetical protein